jgi:FeS assembly protein IscX
MAEPLYWDDIYPIALLLNRSFPNVDPLSVEFDQLQDWVAHLDGFADDKTVMPFEWLEQIQVEWIEIKMNR